MKPIHSISLTAILLLSAIGCSSEGGSGNGPQSRAGGDDALVGIWKNQSPTSASDEVGDSRSQTEVTFEADGSAKSCQVGSWTWNGSAWMESSSTPRCSRNGQWAIVAPGVFRWSAEYQDGDSWESDLDYAGYSVRGDSLYNWSVRLWAGAGPLVGTELRDAGDPEVEYQTLELTADGKMITREYYEGLPEYADTSRYSLLGSDRLLQYHEWSETPDTIAVLKIGGGFIFSEYEERAEAFEGDAVLLRKR